MATDRFTLLLGASELPKFTPAIPALSQIINPVCLTSYSVIYPAPRMALSLRHPGFTQMWDGLGRPVPAQPALYKAGGIDSRANSRAALLVTTARLLITLGLFFAISQLY